MTKFKKIIGIIFKVLFFTKASSEYKTIFYDYKLNDIDGKNIDLSKFKDRAILVVVNKELIDEDYFYERCPNFSKEDMDNYETLFIELYEQRNNLKSERKTQTFINIFEKYIYLISRRIHFLWKRFKPTVFK